MKKVVLLAGALAMGMASAPMAANAANPGVNDVQEVNLTSSQIESVLNEARVLQAKYHTVMGHARFTDDSVVPADTQKKIQKAYNHVTSLIEEGEKLIDGKVNASLIFNATGIDQGEFKFNPYLSTMPEWVKDYKGLTSKSTIADLLEKQTVAYSAILASTVSYLETYDNLTALFADKTEQLRAIVNTISNLGDTVYGSDAEELLKKLQALQSDGDDTNFVDFADFQNGLSAGNLTEKVNDFMELLETLQEGLDDLNSDVVAAVKVKAANVVAAEELTGLFKNLVDIVKTAAVGDVYESDAANLEEDRAELLGRINVELGYIAEYLLEGKVVENYETSKGAYDVMAEDVNGFLGKIKDAEKVLADNKLAQAELVSKLGEIEATLKGIVLNPEALYEDDYEALFEKYDALRDLIATAQEKIEAAFAEKTATGYDLDGNLNVKLQELLSAKGVAENRYASNVVAAEELTGLFKNLVDIVKTAAVGDVYESDAANLEEDRADLLEKINVELGYIAADLLSGEVVDNYETSKGAYDVIAEDVNGFLGKIKDAEKVLADNKHAQAELVSKLGEIEATIKGIVLNPEALYEDDYEALFEKYDALRDLIATAQEKIEAAFAEKTATGYDLDGNLNVKLVELLGAKMEAENVWAANVEGKNALLSYMQTLLTTINTTLAVTKCAECDPDQTGTIEDLYNEVADVEALINAAFNDKKTAKEVAGSEFTNLNTKLYEYEQKLSDLKKEIVIVNERVLFSQKAAENVLDKMLDFNFWMADAKLLEGSSKFLVRNPSCSNPDVLYFNELQEAWDALKAEVESDNTHEGGHSAFDNYNSYVNQLNALKEKIEVLKAAIEANEAAYALIKDKYEELKKSAEDAYNFWTNNLSDQVLDENWYNVNRWWMWVTENEILPGNRFGMIENALDNLYNYGAAASGCTVDAQGKEFNDYANGLFNAFDEELAKSRNDLAYREAELHWTIVNTAVREYLFETQDAYSLDEDGVITWDPFVRKWENGQFVGPYEDWVEEVEGEYGLIASLNLYKQDIEAAYAEGVMEDAINIDAHNLALGLHQQLDGVAAVLEQIKAEYAVLFEAAHHLTNGKTIYSDQEYFTLGFFKKANAGLGEQAQEMFNTVLVNDMDLIHVLDLTAYESETVYDDPTDFDSPYTVVYAKDEDGNLIRWNDGYATDVQTLVHGYKANELSFNIPQPMAPLAVTTLLAGPASVEFEAGSISVDDWTTKHDVTIAFNVEAPVVEEEEVDTEVQPEDGILVVTAQYPVDLTYTSKVLVATTDAGEKISFADAQFDVANGQIKFALPAGTQSVELPEGFFTFRTGENSIALSAAKVVAIGGTQTSIDALIAMGEKAQVFDLQGRRVNVETLVKGNTYVVNGVKTIVK